MRVQTADTNKRKKSFLRFRKSLFANSNFIDNDFFMIKKLFDGSAVFLRENEAIGLYVEDDESGILCEGIIAYSKKLPEYVMLCFFQSLPGKIEAVRLLVDSVSQYGRSKNCKKIAVGINGHLNYGLGLLSSDYESTNSFSSPANSQFVNDCFRELCFDEVLLNTYVIDTVDDRLDRYQKLHRRISARYTFRTFNRKDFDGDVKLFTDLNNTIFVDHKFYYPRTYEEDYEMIKELFLFVKEDSLYFIYDRDKPIGFFLWYPDFNELAHPGDRFGAGQYIRSVFHKKYRTAKFIAFGLLEEYRKKGIPISIACIFQENFLRYGVTRIESSWILADNADSNNVAGTICDRTYKKYTVYEKDLYAADT